MTRVVLITAQPRNASTGAAETIRLAGGGNRKGYYYGGNHYRAGVAQHVRLKAEIGFDETGWTGGSIPTTGEIAFAPYSSAVLAELASYVWRDAQITVQDGDEETETFATRLTGTVADAKVSNHRLVITVSDLATKINKPILTARFTGEGGIEGGDEAKGRIKRRSFGRLFNVEGRVLDKVNSIYEFSDPAFPLEAIDLLRDKGAGANPAAQIVTWQGSIASTLAALIAATAEPGSGVVAPSIACAKWWTQPVGPLTANLRGEVGSGYVETIGSIAERILAAVSGPTITNVSTINSLRAGIAGIHIEENDTTAAILDRLFLPASLLWLLNANGTITAREISFDAPVEELRSDIVERTMSLPPVRSRRLGYQKAWRVHDDGEISAGLDLPLGQLTGWITNPTQEVPVDSSGTPVDLSAAVGEFYVYVGDERVTAEDGVVFSIDIETGGDFDITSEGVYGVLSVAPEVDANGRAFATLRADLPGYEPLLREFEVRKIYPGTDGVVSWTRIVPSPAVARYDGLGSIANPSETFTWYTEVYGHLPISGAVYQLYRVSASNVETLIETIVGPSGLGQPNEVDGTNFTVQRLSDYEDAELGLAYMSGAQYAAAIGSGIKLRMRITASYSVGSDTFTRSDYADIGKVLDGSPAISSREISVYRRATSTPSIPSGGSYNFTTGVLTPPSGWSSTIPAGNDPIYEARGVAAVFGSVGTDTPDWLGVGLHSQEGAAVNVIFKRSATAPTTPAASSGIPSTWYDETGDVPDGDGEIWSSFGTRPNAGANWTWQAPVKIEGSDGLNGNENMWPDNNFETLGNVWSGPIVAPFSFVTNGAASGHLYNTYMAMASSPSSDRKLVVRDNIGVIPGDKLFWGYVGGRVGGSGNGGIYARFLTSDGSLVGSQIELTNNSAVTLSGSTWPDNRGELTVPANAAFIEIGFIKKSSLSGNYYVALPYLSRSQPGADITAEYQSGLNVPKQLSVFALSSGTAVPDQFPLPFKIRYYQGGVDRTSDATLSIDTPYNVTLGTLASNGNCSLTAVNGQGSFWVEATLDGGTPQRKKVPVDYIMPLNPIDTGIVSPIVGATGVSNTSYGTTPLIGPTTVNCPGGFIEIYRNLPIMATSGSGNLEFKLQARAVPGSGSWVDIYVFGGLGNGADAVFDAEDPRFGRSGGSIITLGPSDGMPSGLIEVRVLPRKVGTATKIVVMPGTFFFRGY